MLKPIGDHILVKPLDKEEKTKSGLYIPDSAQEKPQQGTVIALGTGKYNGDTLISFEAMGIAVGDVIMFAKYGPTEVKLDDEEYYILDTDDILGVIQG